MIRAYPRVNVSVAVVQAGHAGFAALVEPHLDRMYSLALRLSGERSAQERIVGCFAEPDAIHAEALSQPHERGNLVERPVADGGIDLHGNALHARPKGVSCQ